MPKRKVVEQSESEESEGTDSSSSEEEKPVAKSSSKSKKPTPTVKKPKFASSKKESESEDEDASATQIKVNSEGDKYIDLGKKKRAVVRSFKGMVLLDIREYYGAEGEEKPGKKGISLTLDQWKELKNASEDIDKLLSQLKK